MLLKYLEADPCGLFVLILTVKMYRYGEHLYTLLLGIHANYLFNRYGATLYIGHLSEISKMI